MMELGLLLISIVIMFLLVLFWMVDRSNLQDTIYKYERKIRYLEREKDKNTIEPIDVLRLHIKTILDGSEIK